MQESPKRTALVTGGSRGIGAAIVAELTARGVTVLAPSRQDLDLANPNSVDQFLQRHGESGAHVDILINNAGINFIAPIEKLSDENWRTTFQVNLHAPFRLIQGFAPAMKERRWGGSSASARFSAR
jgi:NAD(P)-dependent dehydrogenase (short-subunit alcohol dehydrogenase family)